VRLSRQLFKNAAAAAAGALLCAAAEAGTVHIRWSKDAPERLASRDVLLYEHVVALRDSDPAEFDKRHPFFGRLLRDADFMDSIVRRWESHEQRFEYYHPYLWQVLNGYIHEPKDPPWTPPPGHDHTGDTTGDFGGLPQGGGGDVPPPAGGGGSPASVPEPPSALLLLIGSGASALGACWLRARRLLARRA
jgi:hypothetical protein